MRKSAGILEGQAASTESNLNVLAEDSLGAGDAIIHRRAIVGSRLHIELTKLNQEIAVLTFDPNTVNLATIDIRSIIHFRVAVVVDTSLTGPVLVDLHLRLESEQQTVRVGLVADAAVVTIRYILFRASDVTITDHASPLHVVHFLLESGNADAKIVQLIGELSSQLVDQGLVSAAFRHSAGNHLRHFIAGDLLVATVGAVAITFDDAVSSKLSDSVISPMIGRDILERVRSSERRGGCANDESRRQSGYESFLHNRTGSQQRTSWRLRQRREPSSERIREFSS